VSARALRSEERARSAFLELRAIDGAERPGADPVQPLGPRIVSRSALARLGALAERLWSVHDASVRAALAGGAGVLARELGFSESEAELIARAPSLAPPPVRADFVRTRRGFQLLEWNVDPCLGGLAGRRVMDAYERAGRTAGLDHRDPADALRPLLARLAGRARRVAIAIRDQDRTSWGTNAERYAEIARAAGFVADVTSVQAAARSARTAKPGDPLAILRCFHLEHVPSVRGALDEILHHQDRGRALLVFGFDCELGGDKQWLARVQWPADLRCHVPEARLAADCADELLASPASWVLKPHAGSAGSGVIAGINIDAARWRAAVELACRTPGTIAQRLAEPLARQGRYVDTSSGFLLSQREVETLGIFLVDGRFAGAYSRSQPAERGVVIDARASFNVVATRKPARRVQSSDAVTLPCSLRRLWSTPSRERLARRLRCFDDLAVGHLTARGGARWDASAAEAGRGFRRATWPEQPATLGEIRAELADQLLPFCHDKREPTYFSHMDVPPADLSIAAGTLIRALSQDPVTWTSSRAGTFLEQEVVRYFTTLCYPEQQAAGGVPCSGGTQANLLAILLGRNLALEASGSDVSRLGLAEALRQSGARSLKVLASEKAHLSVGAAIRHAGLGDDNHVQLPVDADDAVRLDALEAALVNARRDGDRVALVVLNAGTVGVGAIDPLRAATELAHRHGARVHVDAAHGSMLLFSRRSAELLSGIEQADSVSSDPHKLLGLNQGLGMLLLKQAADREAAAKQPAPYFLSPDGAPEAWRYPLDGTRPLNALGAFVLMRHLGRAGYARIVDHFLELAALFESKLREHGGFELYGRRSMNLCAFRPKAASDAEVERLIARINAGKYRASRYQSSRGSFIRAVFVNPATTGADVAGYVDVLARALKSPGDLR
jgi:glutamate/tyrosine decarboxylase-like PLP-dependent enzyme